MRWPCPPVRFDTGGRSSWRRGIDDLDATPARLPPQQKRARQREDQPERHRGARHGAAPLFVAGISGVGPECDRYGRRTARGVLVFVLRRQEDEQWAEADEKDSDNAEDLPSPPAARSRCPDGESFPLGP